MKVVKHVENETLLPYTRSVLYEKHMPKKERLLADVRMNVVIKFCQVVNLIRATMEEKALAWIGTWRRTNATWGKHLIQ